jgi:hypothetical protein
MFRVRKERWRASALDACIGCEEEKHASTKSMRARKAYEHAFGPWLAQWQLLISFLEIADTDKIRSTF